MTSPLTILKMLYTRYITITKTPLKPYIEEQNTGEIAAGTSNDKLVHDVEKCGEIITNKSCRICMQEGSVYIFTKNTTEDLAKALNTIGGIEIKIDDSYPKYLCQVCLALLQGAILFRKTAQQADNKLKQSKNIKIELEIYDNSNNNETNFEEQTNLNEESVKFEQPKKEEFSDATEHMDSISNKDTESVLKSKKSIITHKQLNKGPKVEKSGFKITDSNLGKHDGVLEKKRKTKIYKCSACALQLNSFEEYIDHKLSSHMPEIKRETCTICNKMFPLWLIKRHMDSHKLGISRKDQIKKNLNQNSFECDSCNLKFKSCLEYKNHKLSAEHQNIKQPCTICKKSFKLSYIKLHMITHETEKLYICDVCGKSFKRLAVFNSHSATHLDIFPFECSYCPYKARRKSDLKLHIRIHTGEKPFQCHECPQRFVTKSNLNKHLWTHKTDGCFECDTCGKKYRSKAQLTLHIDTVHLGNDEHICQDCNNIYKSRKQMLVHQRRVHKREKLRSGRMPNHLIDIMKQQGL